MKYLEGVSVSALARGNRRMLAPLKGRHQDARADHAKTLAKWKKRRAKALKIEDPEQRAAALEKLKAEKPTHPGLIAAGAAVAAAVIGWPATHGHHTELIATGGTLWLLAALVLGQQAAPDAQADPVSDSEDESDDPADDDDQEQAEQPPATPDPARQAEVIRRYVEDAVYLATEVRRAGRGVHLSTMLAELTEAGVKVAPDTAGFRLYLESIGVPVRSLSLGPKTRRQTGLGVHCEELSKALGRPLHPSPRLAARLATDHTPAEADPVAV